MKTSPQFTSPQLAVVMPIYNEAANIGPVLRDWFSILSSVAPDFIFLAINDGSKDDTHTILSSLRCELGSRLRIVNKQNSGHGNSCRHGYEMALREGAAWILQIDSDGQCDPMFFPHFYQDRDGFDCLFGYRRTRGDGFGRLIVSRCSRALLWLTTATFLKDPNVPYRLIRARALRSALRRIPSDFDLQNIALSVVLKRERKRRWKDIPIHFRARTGGETSMRYGKIAKMGIDCLCTIRKVTHASPQLTRGASASPAGFEPENIYSRAS
jgi:glycosyltransferase involved in cell wall biosynthesis